MRIVQRFLLSILVSMFVSNAAFAAAFQLYELGTPIIGLAGVGQAALAEDASTTFFNPAGMALLDCSQFMLGSQLILPDVEFAPNAATTISGNNGGNAGALTPGMNVYTAYSYSPRMKFGFSVTSPYGGLLDYNDGWVGRFVVQNVTFYTINLNPSMAYRVNDWLSLGAGVAFEYMKLVETVALPFTPAVDGQIKFNVHNLARGFNLAALFTPWSTTKIGIAYRSRINHKLHGSSTFLRITSNPVTASKMIMPQNLMLSFAHECQPFTVLAELGWANWSSMQDTILTVRNLSAVTPRKWKNTYRVGLGGRYNVSPALLIQAGVSYDSSPTTKKLRLPDLPMDKQIRVGAGVVYTLIKHVNLGVSYEYMNLGHAPIDNTSSNGALAGSYRRNNTNTLQMSLNVEV